MPLVAEHIQNLEPYRPGKTIDEVKREYGIEKIVKLASNENPLGVSPLAIQAMIGSIHQINRYPDIASLLLRNKLAELFKVGFDSIVTGHGSEAIMQTAVRTFLMNGEEVITAEGTFVGFYVMVKACGIKMNLVPLKDYGFDLKAIVDAITPKTKMIYLVNPNSPTGTIYTKGEFEEFMKAVPPDVLVMVDEAYIEFVKDHPEFPDSMDYRYDNVITLRTFSKAYGLAGIRIGYGFAHEYLIGNLTKIKLPFEPNLIAQLGACAALRDTPHLKKTLKNNEKRYHEAFKFLKKNDLEPIKSVANFITIKTGSEQASNWIFEMLLNRGVIIRPLKANEMSDFLRISLGSKDEMNHFYESMTESLPEYQRIKN